MIIENNIQIKNIYYMLSYAFKVLKEHGFEKIDCESFDNTAKLLSTILEKGISYQVKRGLGKEYILHTEPLSTLRGKIDISQSIKTQTMLRKQLVCHYDDFSVNTILNQIIKTTVFLLLKEDIERSCKKSLIKLMMYFQEVNTLNPYTINWNIKFNRNNQTYQMLINICYLAIKGLLQKDENGDMKMQKFLDEQKMCKLYEKFILEYYKKHHTKLKVSSSQIQWQVTGEKECLTFLPTMQSDIMLSNGKRTLIIDAKYYSKTTSMHYDKKSFHSSNLYQIFTYVKNHDKKSDGSVSGMLLYAKPNEEASPEAEFKMDGNEIYIRNLDLNADFSQIQKKLDSIAELL